MMTFPRFLRLTPPLMAVILAVPSLPAPTDLSNQYREPANRLIDAALADNAGYARLAYLCDRIGNRLSGSPSLLKAIAWAASEMKGAGLENVATPPVKVPHWVRGSE